MDEIERIEKQIASSIENGVILNKRYLDDEQLSREEQKAVLREIFQDDQGRCHR